MVPVAQTASLDAAYAAQDWPLVETLSYQHILRHGYSWQAAKKMVEALIHLKRSHDAVSRMAGYYAASSAPSRVVCYAHALYGHGKFEDARAIYKPHAGFVNPTSGSFNTYFQAVGWRISVKEFEVTWQLTDGTSGLHAIALPQNSYNQQLGSYAVTGGMLLGEMNDELGNKLIGVALSGNETFRVTARVKLTPKSVRHVVAALPDNPWIGPGFPLGVTPGIDPTTATVNAKTQSFADETYREKISRVMLYANNVLTYTPPGSPGGLDHSEDVLLRGGGHCEGLTMAIAALMRNVGIPARMIRGQSAIWSASGEMQQHTVIQYWLPNAGWVDWDHMMDRWELRSDFIRLGSYEGAPVPQQEPLNFWHHREFIPGGGGNLNGPYHYQLIGQSF